MSKLRSISTSFWEDTWVEDLSPNEKLLFIHLLTNNRTNMLGIYEISVKKITFETGISKDSVVKILKKFEKEGRVLYKENYIILVNYLKHQNFNLNMKKSAIDVFNKLTPIVKGCDIVLKKSNVAKDYVTLYKALRNTYQTLPKVEDEVEEETKKEKPLWKVDYNAYLESCKKGYKDYNENESLIKQQEELNPNIDIKLTLKKSFLNYWGTEVGWKKKKASKSNTIDWKQTITNAITLPSNKVYKQK